MASYRFALSSIVLALLAPTACGSSLSSATDCTSGADCASGVCRSDNTCLPMPQGSAGNMSSAAGGSMAVDGSGPGAGGAQQGGAGKTGGTGGKTSGGKAGGSSAGAGGATQGAGGTQGQDGSGAADGAGPDGAGGSPTSACALAPDGEITAEMSPLVFDQPLPLLLADATSPSLPFDSAGTEVSGVKTWDFRPMLANDASATLEAKHFETQWFASTKAFAGATHVARLSFANNLLGVFKKTADQVLLLGMASPTEDAATKTVLAYDPPVVVLQFPFHAGASWSTSAIAKGVFNGIPIGSFGDILSDTYEVTVDAQGVAKTPASDVYDFPVLRVNTKFTHEYTSALSYQYLASRIMAFVTPCYGTIASASWVTQTAGDSPPDEFTTASEVWRITQ